MIKVGKINESISLKDIQNAKYAASFMNDRADITIDGLTYAKIGKNKWEHIPANPHAFGGTYTDEQIYDKVKNSKKCNLNESLAINEFVNYKGLVNLASKNEDVSKHKDLGKACWQYLFPRIKDMARELDIEDTNIIVKAIYDWIKKHENMNESMELNESAKIGKMTKAMGQGYSGVWQLPSGSPGLFAEAGDCELVVLGDEEGIQIILQDEDDIWFKSYPANKEKEAVAEFKKVAALLTDLVDASKLAKKFGLTTM